MEMLLNLLMSMLLAEMIPILLAVSCFRCVSYLEPKAYDLTHPGASPANSRLFLRRREGFGEGWTKVDPDREGSG